MNKQMSYGRIQRRKASPIRNPTTDLKSPITLGGRTPLHVNVRSGIVLGVYPDDRLLGAVDDLLNRAVLNQDHALHVPVRLAVVGVQMLVDILVLQSRDRSLVPVPQRSDLLVKSPHRSRFVFQRPVWFEGSRGKRKRSVSKESGPYN